MGNEASEACLAKSILFWISIAAVSVGVISQIFNEARHVYHRISLKPLTENFSSVSCVPSESHNGKFVHLVCPLRNLYTFYPPSAFSRNLSPFDGAFFEVKVEMYQRVQRMGITGPYTTKDFDESLVGTTEPSFFSMQPYQKNPAYFPHIPGRGRAFAPYVKAGGFFIFPSQLAELDAKRQLNLRDDGWFVISESRPPFVADYRNTVVKDDALYTGDPASPQLGDLKISFWGSSISHLSFLGLQTVKDGSVTIGGNAESLEYRIANILAVGEHSSADLIKMALAQMDGSMLVTWLLRICSTALASATVCYYAGNLLIDKPIWSQIALSTCVGTAITLLATAAIWAFYKISISAGLLSLSMVCVVIVLGLWVYVLPERQDTPFCSSQPLVPPIGKRRTPSAPSSLYEFHHVVFDDKMKQFTP